MNLSPIIFIITFILAFCSLVYELLLGQILSAYLGNTILRYSITIGLYMLSMGIGAFLAGKNIESKAILILLFIEILLTLIGGNALLFLSWLSGFEVSTFLFSTITHSFIILIGILTGFEIPLLMYIAKKIKIGSDNIILGIDYIGAFLGAILFAFYFYIEAGLMKTSYSIALLNAITGLMLLCFQKHLSLKEKKIFNFAYAFLFFCTLLTTSQLYYINYFREYWIEQFLK